MKKFAITIVCLLALSITAIPAGAQTRSRFYNRNVQTISYNNGVYRDRSYRSGVDYNNRYGYNRWEDNRSFWDKHRDKITTAAGVGAGAVIGGLVAGKKGAILGALAGGGGPALYTYKIRDKNYYRY
jgi:hypothetical protein